MYSLESVVCSVESVVCSVESVVCSVKCVVCSVKYGVTRAGGDHVDIPHAEEVVLDIVKYFLCISLY